VTALMALLFGGGCARTSLVPLPTASGAIEGRVLAADATKAGEWVVVYLDGPALEGSGSGAPGPAKLRSGGGELRPAVVAVAAGQSVTLASEDGLHHRFFSKSRPQGFEPVDVASGQRRKLSFASPGVVRVYCSLHPSERGTIVVAPSRHYSTLRAPGGYALRKVPPGEYDLHTWSETHPDDARSVKVNGGESTIVEIELGTDRDS
jgi:plastocyanin